MAAYQKQNGSPNVPFDCITSDGFKLGQWVTVQRRSYRKGTLDQIKRKRLEALGMEWSVFQNKWQTGLEHAMAFARANGHLNVRHQYVSEDGYRLGGWISTQRERYKEGRISEAEVQALEAIGMKWRSEYHHGETGIGQTVRTVF